MRQVFVLLARGAPLHVLFYPLSCFWPEVVPLDFSYGFISSGVSAVVVPVSCDFFLDFFVWWDHKLVRGDGPPPSMFLSLDYLNWQLFRPLFHNFFVAELGIYDALF